MEFRTYSMAELMEMYPPRDCPAEPTERVTFDQLVELEPALAVLMEEVKGHEVGGEHFCANAIWYGYGGFPGIKPRLLLLVGWERSEEHPLLSTRAAYDCATDTLYEALPDCRNCGCLPLSLP